MIKVKHRQDTLDLLLLAMGKRLVPCHPLGADVTRTGPLLHGTQIHATGAQGSGSSNRDVSFCR